MAKKTKEIGDSIIVQLTDGDESIAEFINKQEGSIKNTFRFVFNTFINDYGLNDIAVIKSIKILEEQGVIKKGVARGALFSTLNASSGEDIQIEERINNELVNDSIKDIIADEENVPNINITKTIKEISNKNNTKPKGNAKAPTPSIDDIN